MRDRNVVEQGTHTLWVYENTAGRGVRISERYRRYIEDGVSRREMLYRAEEREEYSLVWTGLGDVCVWVPLASFAWAQLDSAVRSGHFAWIPSDVAARIEHFFRESEWFHFGERVHEDAIREDKIRAIVATLGVDALLDITSSGQLLEVLRSLKRAA